MTAPEGSGLSDGDSSRHPAANLDDGSAKGWLPVMPVQMGINIPLVSSASPAVKDAVMYEGYAKVEFSLYMDTATLTADVITVSDGSNQIPCTLTFPDGESDPADSTKTYARTVRLTPADGSGFDKNKTYTVSAAAGAKGYNDKALGIYNSGALAVQTTPPELDGAASGDTLTYTVRYAPEGATLIAARYDQGQMTAVKVIPSPAATGELTMSGTGSVYKLFLVNASNSPLCEAWSSGK